MEAEKEISKALSTKSILKFLGAVAVIFVALWLMKEFEKWQEKKNLAKELKGNGVGLALLPDPMIEEEQDVINPIPTDGVDYYPPPRFNPYL